MEGYLVRLSKMQMDVQQEGKSEESWISVIRGNRNQCIEVVSGSQTPAGIIVFTPSLLYVILHSCFMHALAFFSSLDCNILPSEALILDRSYL